MTCFLFKLLATLIWSCCFRSKHEHEEVANICERRGKFAQFGCLCCHKTWDAGFDPVLSGTVEATAVSTLM